MAEFDAAEEDAKEEAKEEEVDDDGFTLVTKNRGKKGKKNMFCLFLNQTVKLLKRAATQQFSGKEEEKKRKRERQEDRNRESEKERGEKKKS